MVIDKEGVPLAELLVVGLKVDDPDTEGDIDGETESLKDPEPVVVTVPETDSLGEFEAELLVEVVPDPLVEPVGEPLIDGLFDTAPDALELLEDESHPVCVIVALELPEIELDIDSVAETQLLELELTLPESIVDALVDTEILIVTHGEPVKDGEPETEFVIEADQEV